MRIDGTPITGQAHTYTPTQQCRRKHNNSTVRGVEEPLKKRKRFWDLTKRLSTWVAENRNNTHEKKKKISRAQIVIQTMSLNTKWPSEESRTRRGMQSIIITLDTRLRHF